MTEAGGPLTGRINAVPSELWHDEVLAPQFGYEVRCLLPWYVAIEKVLLLEYRRMGLTDQATAAAMAARLSEVDSDLLQADPAANLSDIAFAIERHVASGPVPPFPAWHVDRSRNDLQACAQLLYARGQVVDLALALVTFGQLVAGLAGRTAELPMPGYTHLQAAQVVTPGFYLSALSAETLRTLRRLRLTYTEMDACPLGAGAMAGQELDWDLQRMASLLGFLKPASHALAAVASRGWALSVAGDLSGYGVALSRFATDLMAWGSGAYGFVDLPDELSGISSAMPQKKNFPILERIRGRTAHLTTFALDLALGQRNTPYANMVEVSKEAGTYLRTLFDTLRSVLALFSTVVEHLEFRAGAMREACERDYLGGFSLANLLTLRAGVPWRTAQVIAGRYVVAATGRGLPPGRPDGALLAEVAAAQGHRVDQPEDLLAEAFSVDGALLAKQSPGSANPKAVRELLAGQEREFTELAGWWSDRRAAADAVPAMIDSEFDPRTGPAGGAR